MNYVNKRRKKLLKRMAKRANEGDEYNPYSTADDRLGKKLTLYSRGGKRERSHKMRIGKIVNKNIDRKMRIFKTLDKTLRKIK